MSGDFIWIDAGRTVVLRRGGLAEAAGVLAEHGFAEFELLSTPRALRAAPALAEAAARVHEVPPGQVPGLAADLLDSAVELRPSTRDKARQRPLVALGGGRVIDVAKAAASVTGARVAAIPTTMSGAEMSQSHRLPSGTSSASWHGCARSWCSPTRS